MAEPGWRSIESPRNDTFRAWESLLDSRGLKKHRQFLLSGRKTVPEALALWPDRFSAVIVRDPEQVRDLPLPPGLARYLLPRELFETLDVAGTGVPLLVGTVPEMPTVDLARPPRGLELVCALGDPNNLGALLRSAAAFGAARIVLLTDAAHPFHPRCLRAAANAVFRLELCRGPGWAGLAGIAGPVAALDGDGADLTRFAWPADLRLILGEEGLGVPPGLAVQRLAIPTSGLVESLNATVAASVALYARYAALRSRSRS